MRFCRRTLTCLLFALAGIRAFAGPYDEVTVDTSSTSIYVGSVTLSMSLLKRTGGTYAADYRASVVPLFFYNESGRLWIDFSDADLERLAKGETVQFTGHAENDDKKPRTITGRAVPADATQGKIKVRIGVTSPKVELIFNTHYKIVSPAEAPK